MLSVRVSLGSEVKRFPEAVRVPATATRFDPSRSWSLLSRLAHRNFEFSRSVTHHVT